MTIIVFISIYFELYCKIPARSNKSMLHSFPHRIYIHVKGMTRTNAASINTTTGNHTKT